MHASPIASAVRTSSAKVLTAIVRITAALCRFMVISLTPRRPPICLFKRPAVTRDMILANPPFAGSLDYEQTARDLQQVVKTRKTELLFLALTSST